MISVVTITCREKPGFDRAAESLAKAGERVKFEWIVVDERLTNGRFDRSSALYSAVRLRFAYFHCQPPLSRERAQGLPDPNTARNEGLRRARGDYVVFLDDNMTVSPGWLRDAETAAQRDQGYCSGLFFSNRSAPEKISCEDTSWRRIETPSRQCSGIFGAPAKLLRAIGGFDESYGGEMGFEDLDCVVRLAQAGLEFWETRGSYATHHPHAKLPGPRKTARNRAKFEAVVKHCKARRSA